MLITLQEGLDRILHNRAMSMTGLDPDELAAVVMANTDAQGLEIAARLLSLRPDPPSDSLKDGLRGGLTHWRDVNGVLTDLRERFWPEVERDIDVAHSKETSQLSFVDGIPENPRQARVTRTSLLQFIETTFPHHKDSAAPHGVDDAADEAELQSLSRREKYTAKMLVLAARDAIAQHQNLCKQNGSPNYEAIARRWLKHLTSNDARRGLTEDNIARHLSEGIDAI